LHHSMTRARALLFTLLLIGVASIPGQALARVGTGAEVTVGAEAVQIADTSVPQSVVRKLLVCVPEAAAGPIYVGGEGVTTSAGMPVQPGSCYSTKLLANEKLYAISGGSIAVRVQESSSW